MKTHTLPVFAGMFAARVSVAPSQAGVADCDTDKVDSRFLNRQFH